MAFSGNSWWPCVHIFAGTFSTCPGWQVGTWKFSNRNVNLCLLGHFLQNWWHTTDAGTIGFESFTGWEIFRKQFMHSLLASFMNSWQIFLECGRNFLGSFFCLVGYLLRYNFFRKRTLHIEFGTCNLVIVFIIEVTMEPQCIMWSFCCDYFVGNILLAIFCCQNLSWG